MSKVCRRNAQPTPILTPRMAKIKNTDKAIQYLSRCGTTASHWRLIQIVAGQGLFGPEVTPTAVDGGEADTGRDWLRLLDCMSLQRPKGIPKSVSHYERRGMNLNSNKISVQNSYLRVKSIISSNFLTRTKTVLIRASFSETWDTVVDTDGFNEEK